METIKSHYKYFPYCLLGIGLLLNACSGMYYGYPESNIPKGTLGPSTTGKCYDKCIIPDQYETIRSSEKYYIYTGALPAENIDIEMLDFEIHPAGDRWVKRKAVRNCLSSNPDDCLVWCLVQSEAEFEKIPIVTDTSQTKDYKYSKIERTIMVKAGGFKEWREVVCQEELSLELFSKLQTALLNQGYKTGVSSEELKQDGSKLDLETKIALEQYQKDRRLPIGNLNLETLRALGVLD